MNSGESDSCELPLIFPSDVCRGDRVAGNPREGDQTNCTKQNLWCCKVQIAPPKAMWRTFKSLPKYGMRRYIYFGTKTWNSMRRFFFFLDIFVKPFMPASQGTALTWTSSGNPLWLSLTITAWETLGNLSVVSWKSQQKVIVTFCCLPYVL